MLASNANFLHPCRKISAKKSSHDANTITATASTVEYSARHRKRIKITRRHRLSNTRSHRDRKPVKLEDIYLRRPMYRQRQRKPLPIHKGVLNDEDPIQSVRPLLQDSKSVHINEIHHLDRTPNTTDYLKTPFCKLKEKCKT